MKEIKKRMKTYNIKCDHNNFEINKQGYKICRTCRSIKYYMKRYNIPFTEAVTRQRHPLSQIGTNRELVNQLRLHHSDWTLQQIGDKVGLTRERVRQILKTSGSKTKKIYPVLNKCIDCGKKKSGTYHSRCQKCLYIKNSVFRSCTQCGTVNRYQPGLVKRTKINFCSRICHGKWLGQNFGRGRGKKSKMNKVLNSIYNLFRSKPKTLKSVKLVNTSYDYSNIISLRQRGLTYSQINKDVGASLSTIYNVLKRHGLINNVKKSHCKHGHLLENNSYITKKGTRQCRVCNTISRYGRYHNISFIEALKIRSDSKWSRKVNIKNERTHCKRGHIFNDLNIIYQASGRTCRVCRIATRKAKYAGIPFHIAEKKAFITIFGTGEQYLREYGRIAYINRV